MCKVAALTGGYGTIGPSIVFAVPTSEIGVRGGELRDVRAFTGVGSYLTGVTRVLDTVRLVR